MKESQKKRCKNILRIIFAVFTIIALLLVGIVSVQRLLCTKKIYATPNFARPSYTIKIDRLSEQIYYTYYYQGKMYIGSDYTSLEKAKSIGESNEIEIWICPSNPSISAYDRKEDLIILGVILFEICILYSLGFSLNVRKKRK